MTVALIMGVSGSGKSTIAAGVAARLGWRLMEGDAFHPPANVAKMTSGTPLTDEDRWPWLRALAAEVDALQKRDESAVVACSALKRAYRAILVDHRPDVVLIYLQGSRALIGERMAARKGHFMPAGLLDSQFATLEVPGEAPGEAPGADENPFVVPIDPPPEAIIETIVTHLREHAA
jgi:carbohydrate kinase (thermoresistant glucokinase family)